MAVWQQTIGADAGRQVGRLAAGGPGKSVTKQQEVTGLVIRQISEWTQGHKDPVLRDLEQEVRNRAENTAVERSTEAAIRNSAVVQNGETKPRVWTPLVDCLSGTCEALGSAQYCLLVGTHLQCQHSGDGNGSSESVLTTQQAWGHPGLPEALSQKNTRTNIKPTSQTNNHTGSQVRVIGGNATMCDSP